MIYVLQGQGKCLRTATACIADNEQACLLGPTLRPATKPGCEAVISISAIAKQTLIFITWLDGCKMFAHMLCVSYTWLLDVMN